MTDRPTDGSACGMARGKIPFIPVADCDLGVSRILFLFDLLDCGSAIAAQTECEIARSISSKKARLSKPFSQILVLMSHFPIMVLWCDVQC